MLVKQELQLRLVNVLHLLLLQGVINVCFFRFPYCQEFARCDVRFLSEGFDCQEHVKQLLRCGLDFRPDEHFIK